MSPLAPELERTLSILADALAGTTGWWIIGSAAAALHGADTGRVGDVDLLFDSENDARALLTRLGVEVRAGVPDGRFRSAVFGRWFGAPLLVEAMAGFEVRDGAGWSPVRPATREPVRGGALWVPARGELEALFRRFGRPRDLARAMALARLGQDGGDGIELTDQQRGELLAVLRRFAPPVERADVYGSRADGTARPGSDVDLVLAGPLDREAVNRVSMALEESYLSIGADVCAYDLLPNGAFRERVVATAVPLFGADELSAG